MGNIIGNVFDDWVKKQVEYRQLRLAQLNPNAEGQPTYGPKTDGLNTWYNAKTAWLRLASSVNISEDIARNLGDVNLKDDGLARKCILMNGVSSIEKSPGGSLNVLDPMSGINYDHKTFASSLNSA